MQVRPGKEYIDTVRVMLHKMRVTMRHREASYRLKGFIEADDAQFEVAKTKKQPVTTSEVAV